MLLPNETRRPTFYLTFNPYVVYYVSKGISSKLFEQKDGTRPMKNNYKKLLVLLLTGCIAFGGCGAPENAEDTETQNNTESSADTDNAENTENTEDTDNAETGQPSDTSESSAASTASAGSSTSNTTFPSASAEPVIPPPLTEEENKQEPVIDNTEIHNAVGIITDATHYSISIQVPDGSYYHMTIPETGVTGNLDYITIGQIATLSYTGSLDENHATLIGISSSSMITGIYLEEYAFAIKIINAARAMDLKALSDLTNFPVFLETGTYSGSINTSGEFEAIDNEKIFSEALVTRLANYNLFDLKYTDAGFVMGNGTPSLTFDVDDDGILGIIGINCNPAPETSQN